MEGLLSFSQYPCAYIMHGDGVTPATCWRDCDSANYVQPCLLVSNTVAVSCYNPSVFLLSLQAVPSFHVNNYVLLSVRPLFTSHRLSLGQHLRPSTKFIAFVVSVILQNTDGSASISRAILPDGSFPRVMSAITKRLHFQSIKVTPLFCYFVFRILQCPI